MTEKKRVQCASGVVTTGCGRRSGGRRSAKLGGVPAKLTKAARRCISAEISKHYRAGKPRGQAVAIGFNVCRKKGFKVPKKRRKR